MSVLPAEVHTALSNLLKGLQSADNVERTNAEEALNKEWVDARPDVLLMGLTEQMQLAQETSVSIRLATANIHILTHDGTQTRNFAAVIFRRQSSKPRKDASGNARDLFLTLQQPEREAIRGKLLQCLASETDNSVRSKIGDAVAEIGRQHTDEGETHTHTTAGRIAHSRHRCPMAGASGGLVQRQPGKRCRPARNCFQDILHDARNHRVTARGCSHASVPGRLLRQPVYSRISEPTSRTYVDIELGTDFCRRGICVLLPLHHQKGAVQILPAYSRDPQYPPSGQGVE